MHLSLSKQIGILQSDCLSFYLPKIRLYLRFLFFPSRYVRISPERFHHLVDLLREKISKENRYQLPIYPEERLAITLRYLATENSQRDVAFVFKIGQLTIYHIIIEVCDKIWDVLNEYVRPSSLTQDWNKIAEELLGFWDMLHCIEFWDMLHCIGFWDMLRCIGFWDMLHYIGFWDMLHCIGALDGKHISIRKPSTSGSLWHDYKGFFSMVLLAVCDAGYCFTLVDVGEYVSNNDNGILTNSKMRRRFGNREMSIPESEKKFEDHSELHYFLVEDKIFPLQTRHLKDLKDLHRQKVLVNRVNQISEECYYHYLRN